MDPDFFERFAGAFSGEQDGLVSELRIDFTQREHDFITVVGLSEDIRCERLAAQILSNRSTCFLQHGAEP
jgi:hypothetical protein